MHGVLYIACGESIDELFMFLVEQFDAVNQKLNVMEEQISDLEQQLLTCTDCGV